MLQSNLPPAPGLKAVWSFVRKPKEFYAWARRQYGEAVTLPADEAPLVLLLTSEGARQILAADPENYDAFHKGPFVGLTGPGSLWVMDGLRHRHERHLLAPQFSAHRVRAFGEPIRQIALRHTDTWRSGQSLRVYESMLDISRDIILLVVFSLERGPLMDEAVGVLKKLLHRVGPLLFLNSRFQSWWFPPWLRYRAAKREFARFVEHCLTERRADGNERRDVLACLLAQREDGTKLSDQEICDQLMTILFAGHETTAVGLSWALYELARHPAVLDQLRRELEALGPDAAPDDIAKQPYLSAVCNETLRLHTILTEVGRVVRNPCEFSGLRLAAGTGVGVSMSAIHEDPALYPEPHAFRPERFLDRRYTAFEFLPFGGGHRRCLGASLSDYEMRIVLATIVTRWDIEPAGEDYDVRHNIGTGPKRGAPLRVKGRRQLGPTQPAGDRASHFVA
jgi:cytochrome P450